MIPRTLERTIQSRLHDKKTIILIGARQTGKTTLLQYLFQGRGDVLWLNGDEIDVRTMFEHASSTRLRSIIAGHTVVVLDEAQRIDDVGLKLKIIYDSLPGVKVVASGSSPFDLANAVGEPMTGRKGELIMFPLSFEELSSLYGLLTETRMLPQRLVYGSYPDVVTSEGSETMVLKQLSGSYLYKDVLQYEHIKRSSKLIDLLRAVAFQVGSEVSLQELSRLVGIDGKTVDTYIDILEQAYIVFRLPSYSRNLRSEIKRGRKIYFYDNGIRNSLLPNYSLLETRSDIGPLWENYLVSERKKYLEYHGIDARTCFWRTHAQQEIDYIEERNGSLYAYEFKWNPNKRVKKPKVFLSAYPDAQFAVITPENYDRFLLGEI